MAEANEAQIREWHEEGLTVVSAYKRCESRIAFLLSKLIESRGYLLYKSESPRQYAVCVWGLPDNAAADLVTVANKAIEIPALLDALEGGRTTVSKLRKICPVIDTKNYKEWIGLTIECSARIVERAVAMTKAETAIYDQLTYKFGNRVEMKAGGNLVFAPQATKQARRSLPAQLIFASTPLLHPCDSFSSAPPARPSESWAS